MWWLLLPLALQSVTPFGIYPKVGWDQAAGTLAEAQAFTYRYYLDGAASGAALSSVTCSGSASPYTCQAELRVTISGPHTLALSAETSPTSRSPLSPPVSFNHVPSTAPTAPESITLTPGVI
jgi:hypothetical protein